MVSKHFIITAEWNYFASLHGERKIVEEYFLPNYSHDSVTCAFFKIEKKGPFLMALLIYRCFYAFTL